MKRIIHSTILIMMFFYQGQHIHAQCAACQFSVDLITNGQFSSGNSGFTTDLNYVTGIFGCPLCPEDTYTIGANAIFYHSGFSGTDHTNPPFGNFFIANGPGASNSPVWCQSFDVVPNTDYTFTFWAQDVTNNNDVHPYAMLQASFNGILYDDTLQVDGDWVSYTAVWNSASSTTLDLCVINQQSNTGGNDFGLDDLSFTGCHNYELSQTVFAGEDQLICSNEIATLGQTPANGYTYIWDNTVGLSSMSVANPSFSLSNTGTINISETYIVTSDSAGVGCIQTDTVIVTVIPVPEFSFGPDLVICPNSVVSLAVSEGWEDIMWSTGQETVIIVVLPGTYSVELSLNGCTISDEITITEESLPLLDLGPDQDLCENDILVLNAGVIGQWSDNSISDTLAVSEAGEYIFLYTQWNCTTSDSISIVTFEMPELSLPSDTLFCEGSSITLNAGSIGLWNTGAVGNTITIEDAGYYDIVSENGPCIAQAGTLVVVNPWPSVDLGSDISTCEDQPINLEAFNDNSQSYLWSTGDTTSFISVTEAGEYYVTASNDCGFTNDTITIDMYPCNWGLYIPSSFTPNDDLINDSWAVNGYNISNVKVYVYNRLGDLIFFTKDISIPWNPSLGIGDDVYNYLVECNSYDGELIERTGHIYLLR